MGSPLRGRGLFVLDRNEGLVCFLFPFGLFLRVVPALRDDVTIWVRRVGFARPTVVVGAAPFLLMDGLRTSVRGFSSYPVPTGLFPGGPR